MGMISFSTIRVNSVTLLGFRRNETFPGKMSAALVAVSRSCFPEKSLPGNDFNLVCDRRH
jgi:hypothetical protein